MTSKILLSEKKLEIILNRLCHQLKKSMVIFPNHINWSSTKGYFIVRPPNNDIK